MSINHMWSAAVQPATQSAGDAGFSLGTLLMFVGGAVLLAFFCSIGLIARLRENKIQERKLQRLQPRSPDPAQPDSR